jgi:hypothetical protein
MGAISASETSGSLQIAGATAQNISVCIYKCLNKSMCRRTHLKLQRILVKPTVSGITNKVQKKKKETKNKRKIIGNDSERENCDCLTTEPQHVPLVTIQCKENLGQEK